MREWENKTHSMKNYTELLCVFFVKTKKILPARWRKTYNQFYTALYKTPRLFQYFVYSENWYSHLNMFEMDISFVKTQVHLGLTLMALC